MRWAILRHDVPGEGWHLDLLLARPDSPPLVTFRVSHADAPALLGRTRPCTFSALRLPDHRRVYLDHEGEVSGGRGSVTRLESGSLEWLGFDRSTLRARLHPLGLLTAASAGENWNLSLETLELGRTSPNLGG
ncbi:MAG: hypothetical protein DYG92_07310 [Leptolyngbya sp. PLA1]|nr:hypothetical protein [Leptolyngbya sp. PLA1]